jgi:hypothetical protein
MDDDTPRAVRFPVSCPVCRRESIAEYRHADLIGALINHRPIRLYAPCHDTSWAASYVEIQRIRGHLGVVRLDTPERTPQKDAREDTDD